MPDTADKGHLTPRARFWLRIVALFVGAAILLSSMTLVFANPVANTTQAWVIRAAVSLSGGLVAMGMLGFLQIGVKILSYTIKAGGPLAVVVLLYTINPPDSLAESRRDDESKDHIHFFAEADRAMRTADQPDKPLLGGDATWAQKKDEISREVTGLKFGQLARSATPEQLRNVRQLLEQQLSEETLKALPKRDD